MNRKIIFILLMLTIIFPVGLTAQSSVKGNSVNGATGIIVTPTARIGWEQSDFGLDFGYSFLYDGATMQHVPTATFSFLKKIELGSAFVIEDVNNWNLLFNGKFQFFSEGGSSMSMGFNIDLDRNGNQNMLFNMTPFIVVSYSGEFFTWPATTSVMFGWNMVESDFISSNFSFSMGFEMSLIPDVFQNYIYWITDFSNYSYASNSVINAGNRGAFNTGIRIAPVKHNSFKLVIDLVGTDLLDSSRGFMASATFGFGF